MDQTFFIVFEALDNQILIFSDKFQYALSFSIMIEGYLI